TEMKKRVVLSALAACATLSATQWTASANFFPKLYVTSLSGRFASDEPLAKPGAGTVGTYNGQTGTTLDAALVLGLHGPVGIAVSGADLFVANHAKGTIGEYTTSGATVNANLIAGLKGAEDIAVSGGNLFVTNFSNGTIGEFTVSGVTVNRNLITGLHGPEGIAIFGNELFVINHGNGTIGEYTTSGATVNAAVITGLHGPLGSTTVPFSGSVADASSSWLLLLFGLLAAFGLKVIVRQPA